jgi:Macin
VRVCVSTWRRSKREQREASLHFSLEMEGFRNVLVFAADGESDEASIHELSFQIMSYTLKLTALVLVAACLAAHAVEAEKCFEAWSRCTGWSSAGTGVLWKTCAGRCQLCMGRAGGQCVHVNGPCGARQQCQCSGPRVPKSTSWIDRATCFMEL